MSVSVWKVPYFCLLLVHFFWLCDALFCAATSHSFQCGLALSCIFGRVKRIVDSKFFLLNGICYEMVLWTKCGLTRFTWKDLSCATYVSGSSFCFNLLVMCDKVLGSLLVDDCVRVEVVGVSSDFSFSGQSFWGPRVVHFIFGLRLWTALTREDCSGLVVKHFHESRYLWTIQELFYNYFKAGCDQNFFFMYII